MMDALSRHADEILAQCATRELAVEQAFRALSELDREGRAIRRALRFDKLLAETGVSEPDLRAVLDRFRANNCSFLLPSLSVSPTLGPDERIDIGHEALLRRWKTIAGKTEPVNPKTGRPPPGWLAEEQIDGQRYHTLVSLLDGAAGGERATLDDPERTKDWWERLPRTPAWADRYGGKFDEVKRLIDDSIEATRRSLEAERRSRRNWWLAAIVAVVGVVGAGAWSVRQQRLAQENIDKNSMKSAKTLLENVLGAYNDESLDFAGARGLAAISGQFLDNVRASSKTSAADLLWAEALNVEADLEAKLNKDAEALALALKATAAAASRKRDSETKPPSTTRTAPHHRRRNKHARAHHQRSHYNALRYNHNLSSVAQRNTSANLPTASSSIHKPSKQHISQLQRYYMRTLISTSAHT